jgi:hypothetical protein
MSAMAGVVLFGVPLRDRASSLRLIGLALGALLTLLTLIVAAAAVVTYAAAA